MKIRVFFSCCYHIICNFIISINEKEEMDKIFLSSIYLEDNFQTSRFKSESEIATDILNFKVAPKHTQKTKKVRCQNLLPSVEFRIIILVLRRILEQKGDNTKNYRNFYKISIIDPRLISNYDTQNNNIPIFYAHFVSLLCNHGRSQTQ